MSSSLSDLNIENKYITTAKIKKKSNKKKKRSSKRKQSIPDDDSASELQLRDSSYKQIVTATQTTRVLAKNREEFMNWSRRAGQLAHQERGHLYSTMIENPDHDEPETVIEFFVVYGFDCFRNLQRWHDSQTKKDLMKEREKWALPAFKDADEQSVSEELYNWGTNVHRSGWETFISRRSNSPRNKGPQMIPKWKMAIVVVWAVWIVVTVFSIPGSVNPSVGDWLQVADHPGLIPVAVLITSILSTPFITFMIIPLTIHFCRPLLVGPRPVWPHDDNWFVKMWYIILVG